MEITEQTIIELLKQNEELRSELSKLNNLIINLMAQDKPLGKITRRVVRGNPVYEYEIRMPIDNLDEHLANQKKAIKHYETLVTAKAVEDKLVDAKRDELE